MSAGRGTHGATAGHAGTALSQHEYETGPTVTLEQLHVEARAAGHRSSAPHNTVAFEAVRREIRGTTVWPRADCAVVWFLSNATVAFPQRQSRPTPPDIPLLRTSELEYDLPESAIATIPAEPRDAARLMRVARRGDARPEHASVRDLPRYLRTGDLLVLNTTRVLPARLRGVRADTGGKVGGLFLRAASGQDASPGERRWIVLLQGKRLRPGGLVELFATDNAPAAADLRLVSHASTEEGAWVVQVLLPDETDDQTLARVGLTPLPPYILAARKHGDIVVSDAYDRDRYQTIYARERGSVAAPTAGLHLTPAVLAALDTLGVRRAGVVLHVGMGTFKPVETECVEDHPIHSEWCSMSVETRDAILATRRAGGRVICVGTTAARTVESFAKLHQAAAGGADVPLGVDTRLLITPGYTWRWTDGLLTNFHLPRSTLLAMCGAMLEGGVGRLKALYAEALAGGYRFFSYGDAMLMLDD